jgi:tetratricopeptide (TPR) repeat protein
VWEALGDKAGVASSLHQLGMLQQAQGNYAEAVGLYEQSRQVLEALGDKVGVASSLHQLGNVQYLQGNYAEAVGLYEQSLKLKEALGDKAGVARSFGQLGQLAQAQERYPEALGYYVRALILFRALNSPYARLAMRYVAGIQAQVGDEQFVAWWGELAAQLGDEIGSLTPDEFTTAAVEADNASPEAQEGVTVEQLIEQVVQETILIMNQGDQAQRGQLWEALGQFRSQTAGQAELRSLAAFLDGVCSLLEGGHGREIELDPPFDEAWQRIQAGIEGGEHG